MNAKILNLNGEVTKDIVLPKQFSEPIRNDIIKKVVLAIESNSRQPYGAKKQAGMRQSAELSRRRRKYRGAYGIGISRVPRKIFSRRGTRMNWAGAVAPGTVGGRKAHPPKNEKNWTKKINIKENKKAIRSALAACVNKDIVKQRGHLAPDNYPLIIEKNFQEIDKTKKVKDILKKIKLEPELKRCVIKTVRAGKGKARGRKYKKKTGPLIIVSEKCKLVDSARNIPGIDIIDIKNINAKLLAPGTAPGRLTIFTESAIEKLEKEKLFI